MSTPFQPPPSDEEDSYVGEPMGIDQHLVDKIKAQALIDAGYVREQDGETFADDGQLKLAILNVMLERHVVRGKRDLAQSAVTKFELYAELLPNGPGVQSLAHGLEEQAAQEQLKKAVWGWANVGTTGFVQMRVAESGFVLCEAKVSRTKVNEETGKREPTTETARFLTTDRELILTYYTGPAGRRFLAAARKLEAQLGLVASRRPELTAPIARQLGVVVKQAVSAIPHADPRQAAALTASADDGIDEE